MHVGRSSNGQTSYFVRFDMGVTESCEPEIPAESKPMFGKESVE